MSLSETEYAARALPELSRLVEAIDALDEGAAEAELSADILSIEFSDGAKFVINSHRAARQIWVAAERSAWHFDWNPESQRWISSKTGEELWNVIERALSARLGHDVALKRG